MRKPPWGLTPVAGALLSVLTLGYEYTYCLDGPARGLPMAVTRPSHGDATAAIFLGEIERVPMEIDLLGVAGDLVVWSLVAALVLVIKDVATRVRRARPPR